MSARFDNLTILVVDDNHHMRKLVTEILRAIGVGDVIEAIDGSDALNLMRHHPPDIIITDFVMEPTDGVKFVHTVRNSDDSPCPMVPVIMMTGHSEISRVCEARDAGVTEILTKPISARGVLERIAQVIENPRPFVRAETYFGPDRRRKVDSHYKGPLRRQDDEDQQNEASDAADQEKEA